MGASSADAGRGRLAGTAGQLGRNSVAFHGVHGALWRTSVLATAASLPDIGTMLAATRNDTTQHTGARARGAGSFVCGCAGTPNSKGGGCCQFKSSKCPGGLCCSFLSGFPTSPCMGGAPAVHLLFAGLHKAKGQREHAVGPGGWLWLFVGIGTLGYAHPKRQRGMDLPNGAPRAAS